MSTFTELDTGSVLQVNVRDPLDNIVVITGATVKLIYSIGGAAKQTKTMTVTDGPNGIAQYQFLAGELTAVTPESAMTYEVEVTKAGAVVTSVIAGAATIRKRLV